MTRPRQPHMSLSTVTEETLHIGQALQHARKQAGYTLDDISETLCINQAYLIAIENLDKEALPPIGYSLGFIKSYAKHVGLDPQHAVNRYKIDSEAQQNKGIGASPHFVLRKQITLPKGFVAAVTLVSCFSVLALWYASAREPVYAAQTSLSINPLTENSLSGSNIISIPVSPISDDPEAVSLLATGPSWVEIKDETGAVILSRIMITGETFNTQIDKGLILSVRDGGAVDLYRAGDLIGPLGLKGQSLKNIALR